MRLRVTVTNTQGPADWMQTAGVRARHGPCATQYCPRAKPRRRCIRRLLSHELLSEPYFRSVAMSGLYFSRVKIGVALFVCMMASAAQAGTSIAWQTTWSDALFAQAAREHRFVLLDLHAVWCHWCHVMDESTYADARVRQLIDRNYVAVRVDADSDRDLTSRYGNWGWPATVVLTPDGTEIVKRRGYIPPQQMTSLLQAIVDDPSPGPSVRAAAPLGTSHTNRLTPKQK